MDLETFTIFLINIAFSNGYYGFVLRKLTPSTKPTKNTQKVFYYEHKSWGKFEKKFENETVRSQEQQLTFITEFSYEKLYSHIPVEKIDSVNQKIFLSYFEFVLFEHLLKKLTEVNHEISNSIDFFNYYNRVYKECMKEVRTAMDRIENNHPEWYVFENELYALKHWRKHSIDEIHIKTDIKSDSEIERCYEYLSESNASITPDNLNPEDFKLDKITQVRIKQGYFSFAMRTDSREAHLKISSIYLRSNKICTFFRENIPSNFLWF